MNDGVADRLVICLAASLVVLGTAAGCGDSATEPPAPGPDAPRPTTVMVNPATAELAALGATVQLTAEVRDQNNRVMAGATVTWRSGDTSVATVNASGLVTGVAEGVATITASAGSGQGTAEITVMDLDRAALVAFYEATDGPNWVNSENWLTDAPLGEWFGVDTDASGRVVRLAMSYHDPQLDQWISNNASGPVPPELGNLTAATHLQFFRNRLSGPIPPELGDLTNLIDLDFNSNDLMGPIPREFGKLANLRYLQLNHNDLTGPIPPEFGDLVNLRRLWLQSNDLEGPIPESFLELGALEEFRFQGNADLCAPGTAGFASWLDGLERIIGSYCNESDTGVLESLFEATGGPAWSDAEGWLGSPVLAGWHGIRADSLGRVTALDLSRNGLVGRLPARLGELAQMTELRIADNPDLSGRLPLSLDRLALRTLHYSGTGLCAPVYTSFRDWLGAIPSHEGTDAECAPLSDREVLEALYETTGGPDWTNSGNWLTIAPLGDWHGVKVDDQGRVIALGFVANRLTGRIPRELGGLAHLQSLVLSRDPLTGPIPPELGDLANLRELWLGENDLTGPIPPELGRLTNLRWLYLHENDLTGPIPPGLGNLTGLRRLNLAANRLTGRIPPQLGGLANLQLLGLGRNDLTGVVPPELGSLGDLRWLNLAANHLTGRIPLELAGLADLESLYFGENELTGPVPPEFGGLMRLRNLAVQGNAGMSGTLPVSLTNLAALETFQTTGTALCAPSDAAFLDWLEGVPNRRVALCGGEPAVAYLVQAVQSREFPVSLVAGEEALLRVFVTAARDNDEPFPPVRASFHLNGTLAHVVEIPGGPGPIPTEVDEGSLAASVNAVVPAEIVQPGLEMVVDVDPDGTLDPALGVVGRIPATDRVAVDVREMPVLDLTLVPFLWTEDPDSEALDAVSGMAADPEGHELLEPTRTLLPVGRLTVTAHETVMSSSNDAYDLIDQTRAVRAVEGGTGYWMGTMSGSITGAGGLGGGVASFALPNAWVIAHEFGHNFSLPHAPCGGAGGPDPAYPNADGTVGAWGHNLRTGHLVPPAWFDVMGYCDRDRSWISDYFFTKALHFRLVDERQPLVAVLTGQEAESLLLWGGTDTDGEPYLNPAFVVDAPPVLPGAAGEQRIAGWTAEGNELFSLDFSVPETADGDGSTSFAFVLPADASWVGDLESITLSGPGGSAALDGDTDLPMTILIDPGTGQVRGILRDLPQADAAAALAPQAGPDSLDVLFSRGIPDTAAWGR